ncbi:MAG: redoxin family protein [Polyangiaceae bacterium]|nr:redoxin family protein [Polyangiaceae bacterium]
MRLAQARRYAALVAVFSIALAALGAWVVGPVDAVAQVAGARPWLGVAMDSDADGPTGVRINHVIRGSPGDRAGLRVGDRIVRVSTTRVSKGAEVVRTVAGHTVGDAVDVAFLRAGAEQTTRVTLTAFPSQDDMLRMDLVGAFAPPFAPMQTLSGAFPSSIGALRGRVVVLDFWATWCGPCRFVIPKLSALQSRLGAQGVTVLGVSTEDAQDVSAFMRRTAMTYPVAVDARAETTRAYGVVSLPTLVVIDKRGVVRDVSVGYDPGEDGRLESTVRALLAESAPTD